PLGPRAFQQRGELFLGRRGVAFDRNDFGDARAVHPTGVIGKSGGNRLELAVVAPGGQDDVHDPPGDDRDPHDPTKQRAGYPAAPAPAGTCRQPFTRRIGGLLVGWHLAPLAFREDSDELSSAGSTYRRNWLKVEPSCSCASAVCRTTSRFCG